MRYALAAGALLTGMFVSVGGAISGPAQAPRQPVGEIVNPSAEVLLPDGRPAQWIAEPRPQPGAPPVAEVASGMSHAGTRSLLVSAARVTWTNKTLVRPYANYRLSGWIKTEGVPSGDGWGARLELRGGVTMTSAAQRITGTTDWTRVDITFDTGGRTASSSRPRSAPRADARFPANPLSPPAMHGSMT